MVLGLVMIATWIQTGLSLSVGLMLFSIVACGLYFSNFSDRLQRGFTIDVGDGDTSYTYYRIYGSVNEGLIYDFFKYPLGAGMGSSVGTSLPYFLADVQPEAIATKTSTLALWSIKVGSDWGFGLRSLFGYTFQGLVHTTKLSALCSF